MLQNLDSSIEDQIQQLERLQREISESGGDEATISPLQVEFIMSLFSTAVDISILLPLTLVLPPLTGGVGEASSQQGDRLCHQDCHWTQVEEDLEESIFIIQFIIKYGVNVIPPIVAEMHL